MRLSRPLRPLALALCVAISASTAAVAGPAPTEQEKRATARSYVDAGLAAEDAGDYAAAIDFYERAHDLVPHPALLYDMAEAYRHAGLLAEALAHYRRYLAADPAGRNAKDAAAQLAPLEEAIRIDDARKADQARTAEAARQAEDARKAEAARATEIAHQAEEARLTEEVRQAEAARRAEQLRREAAERALQVSLQRGAGKRHGDQLKLTGLAVGVVGLAGLGGGFYYGQRAARLSREVSTRFDADKVAAGERANQAEVILLTTGGVLAAAGAIVLAVGWRAGHRASRLMVTPTAEGASVGVAGAW